MVLFLSRIAKYMPAMIYGMASEMVPYTSELKKTGTNSDRSCPVMEMVRMVYSRQISTISHTFHST